MAVTFIRRRMELDLMSAATNKNPAICGGVLSLGGEIRD
jgi:hypothetical protein